MLTMKLLKNRDTRPPIERDVHIFRTEDILIENPEKSIHVEVVHIQFRN